MGKLIPYCEATFWNDSLVILVGLLELVVINTRSDDPKHNIRLNRSSTDDRGFYRVQWMESGELLLCIYEGGVITFAAGGRTLWHQPKRWDDVFVRCTPELIEFSDDDDKLSAFDLATGRELKTRANKDE